jgi:hypothetical protein
MRFVANRSLIAQRLIAGRLTKATSDTTQEGVALRRQQALGGLLQLRQSSRRPVIKPFERVANRRGGNDSQ